MKRSFNESVDHLPHWMSAVGTDEELFDLSASAFLSSSPRPALGTVLPSLPPPPNRHFAASRPQDVLDGYRRETDQDSGYSVHSTSTEGTPPPRRVLLPLGPSGDGRKGVVGGRPLAPAGSWPSRGPLPSAPVVGESPPRRQQMVVDPANPEDKEEPYRCECDAGKLGVDALIEFIRAHPKMVAVTTDDGSPLLIRTIARQLVGDMRRRRHAQTCPAYPNVPAGLETPVSGDSADGDAAAAAAAAAAAVTPFSMNEAERKALRVVLNRSAAERSRLRKKARFETLSSTLADKDATIDALQEKVRSLSGVVSHLQLLLKLKSGGYGAVVGDGGRDLLIRDRDAGRQPLDGRAANGRQSGAVEGGVRLTALMEEASQAWDRAAHAA
eukprot:TRINITY_DN903_c0_g1_i3.p1 TRINITY_DN903_c0_g1~~TRINITY_DN903_c0_g1_i3.p1  ORF type:complete len:384 (+),score=132.97 TRINITY_DN903_c0_g1_i3:540-1691(+)